MSNYPLGAENDSRAPYNQKENPEIEVDLYVGYSVGLPIRIKTTDYELEEWDDEDGHHWEPNFDNTDFNSLILEQRPPLTEFETLDSDYTIEAGR